jgi:Zn-dependent protease/predicted transcriptional regulator
VCDTAAVRWSIRIGSIAGIRVEIHVTFLLFIGYVAVSQGLLTGNPARALAGVSLVLSIFGCVLLHELGHALAARRYGIRTRDIVLLPIGGIARLQRMPDKPQQEIVVALAGPAVNVVIVGVLWLVLGGLPDPNRIGEGLLASLFWVNGVMVAFNLIPAFPMDGGRVLRALLALRLPYARATRIAAGVGQGIALLFGVVGFFYNPMLMFVALFVFLAAGEEHAMVQARASMTGFPVRAGMITEFEVLDVHHPLQRAVDLLVSGSQQDFPVLENDAPVGILTRTDLIVGLQRFGADAPVGEVVTRDGVVADPNEPLEDAFQRMRERRRTALPVVSGGRLVGMVTGDNVSELLLVQDALRRHAAR